MADRMRVTSVINPNCTGRKPARQLGKAIREGSSPGRWWRKPPRSPPPIPPPLPPARLRRDGQLPAGLCAGVEEAAEALGISPASGYRDWAFAGAWLLHE